MDDWSYLTFDPSLAIHQLDHVIEFCSLVDLTVEKSKTIAWSLDPGIRAQLRQSGFVTKPFTRELGAHLAFTRQFTNRVAKDRLLALDQFWTSLRASKAPYKRKVFAIKAVGLPRCMYGISCVPFGVTVWVQVRRKASAALGMKKPGVNPLLVLGLLEQVDPQQVAIVTTVRDCRDFLTVQSWDERVLPYALDLLDLPPNSTSRVLVDRLHVLGLSFEQSGSIRDRFGSFCLLPANFAEVAARLQLHWQFLVASELHHRHTFKGLEFVNLLAVTKALALMPPDSAALLRLGLCGGFFTENPRAHFDESEGLCKWCGQPDSLRHRFWECQQHADLRSRLAPVVSSIVDALPSVLVLHAWAVYPETMFQWTHMLCQLPLDLPSLRLPLDPHGWNHVFTDGSCYFQSVVDLRFAAWSACLATPFATWTGEYPQLLASAVLPGLIQTAFRAELYALAFALHSAASCSCRVVVWTGSLSVVLKFNLLTKGLGRAKVNTANADLWSWIQRSMLVLGPDAVEVRKVAAHRAVSSAPSRHAAWEFCNNERADQTAKLANLTRPSAFWTLWNAHAKATWTYAGYFREVWNLHTAVAERSTKFDRGLTVDDAVAPAPRPIREFPLHCDVTGWRPVTPEFSREFGPALTARLVAWFQQRCLSFSDSEVKWRSIAVLYVDYQLTFGCAGPLKLGRIWGDVVQRRHLDAERFTFQARLKWFKRCLKLLCTAVGVSTSFETCRPHSDVILSFSPCCSLHWNPWTIQHSENWLRDHLVAPVIRDSTALRNLPLAKPVAALKLPGFAQHG